MLKTNEMIEMIEMIDSRRTTARLLIGIILASILLFGEVGIASAGAVSSQIPPVETEFLDFLKNDKVDSQTYYPGYNCGDFAIELSENYYKEFNKPLGGILLSNNRYFSGYNNHAMNYLIVEGTIVLIEPQTDRLKTLGQVDYEYYILYPDGRNMPNEWDGFLEPDGKTQDRRRREELQREDEENLLGNISQRSKDHKGMESIPAYSPAFLSLCARWAD